MSPSVETREGAQYSQPTLDFSVMENRAVGMGFMDLYFCCVFLSLSRSLDEQEARCRDGMGEGAGPAQSLYLDLIKQLIFRSLGCSPQKSK